MIYKFISWIRSPGSEVGVVWEDARGILAALSEHPLVASVARCAGEVSPCMSSPVDRNAGKSTRGAASMSLYQSVNMLWEHVTVLSEWMGGSDGRGLSVGVERGP